MNRRGAAAAACLAWMLAGAAPAAAAYRAEAPRLVSGPLPPPGLACSAPSQPRTSDHSVAVDPRDPDHLVAAWMQDWPGPDSAGAQSLGVAVSRNGGQTWAPARVPVTGCAGGPAAQVAVNEAQAAIGYDGTAYVTGEVDRGAARLPYAIRSTDGGTRFGAPYILNPTDRFAGQAAVTADPLRHQHAYVSWHRVEPNPLGPAFATSALFMAKTGDSGATWSPPVEVRRPGTGRFDVASRILRPRDGSLVNVFVEQSAAHVAGQVGRIPLRSIRSTDDGASWDSPIEVGLIDAGPVMDPENRRVVVNRFPAPATAQAADGTLYVAWRSGTTTGSSRIDVARSRDAGRSWTRLAPAAVLGTQSFLPQIAVSQTGVIGVSYYDFRGDRPGDGELTTRVWLASSVDRGNSWQEVPLAGPFDARRTLAGGLSLIGDTAGLAGVRQGFVATFNLGPPLTQRGLTELFSSRVLRCSVAPSAARCDPPLRVSGLRLRPNPIRHGRRGRLSFRLSRAAGVSVAVERRSAGTRRGRRCASRKRRGRRCYRYRRRAVLSKDGLAGRNSLRIATKRLPKGRYRARVRAVDAIRVRSPERRIAFRIR